jgi:hypothetical protein
MLSSNRSTGLIKVRYSIIFCLAALFDKSATRSKEIVNIPLVYDEQSKLEQVELSIPLRREIETDRPKGIS